MVEKVNRINSKSGPFDIFVLLGDLTERNFKSEEDKSAVIDFLTGSVKINIPTYICGESESVSALIGGASMADNLTVLEQGSILETSSGVSIGHDNTEKVQSRNRPVDIVVGSKWPAPIALEKSISRNFINYNTSFVTNSKPRYHIIGDGIKQFWERSPFKWNEEEEPLRIGRFIALADQGSDSKCAYAFSISAKILEPKLYGKNPFTAGNNYSPPTVESNKPPRTDDNKRKRSRDKPAASNHKRSKIFPESCFFCLANPNFDKNLIVSIANDSYLALAKGPLSQEAVIKVLGFSGHLLFIPISHVPTYFLENMKAKSVSNNVLTEKQKYVLAARQLFESKNFDTVAYEISRQKGVHISTQIIPVPKGLSEKLQTEFVNRLEASGLTVKREPVSPELQHSYYDYVEIDLPGEGGKFHAQIPDGFRFDMTICRQILASVLGLEDQVDWKKCSQTQEEEKKDGELAREEFKAFDFNLNA